METAISIVETEVIKTQVALPTITPVLQTETSLPTVINTAFYTPVPTYTDTLTPTKIPTTATATIEPTPFTSFGTIFVTGLSGTGENIYSHPDDVFHLFLVPSSEFESLHFTMGITAFHFTKNELTPTPTAITASKWQLSIFRYRSDSMYANQPAIKTNFVSVVKAQSDRLVTSLSTDVKMKDLQAKLGNCSAFTFQVIDEQGHVQQQSSFSINPHYLFFYQDGIKGNMKNGVTVGYPYALDENETEFFHQGKFVTIHKSQGGFYRLSYRFSYGDAFGVSGVIKVEEAARQLSIRFFPYRDDGNYSIYDLRPLTGFLHAVVGYFIVDLPIDYMRENSSGNKYYLQIVDGNEKTIKDDYFEFNPYVP